MKNYLIFTLTANLGAMGGLAGHERRGSFEWPGHSAIIGLLGAALGLRREDDFSALSRLQSAVAIFDPGNPLRDFHTVQTVPSAQARRPQSRPSAIRSAGTELNTIITLRDYRTTPLYGIALWNETSDLALVELCAALEQPVFTLYLGRKSCPLAAPLAPSVVHADDLNQAFVHVKLPPWRQGAIARRLVVGAGVLDAARSEQRHDLPIDRKSWHFGVRQVAIASVWIKPEVA